MKCPHCQHTLITLEYSEIEIDYCVSCHGIWLDSGELGWLLEREGGSDELIDAMLPARTGERGRRCPICQKKMGKVTIKDVLLDRCADHGLWFDERELQDIIKMSGGRLAGLLNEMLRS